MLLEAPLGGGQGMDLIKDIFLGFELELMRLITLIAEAESRHFLRVKGVSLFYGLEIILFYQMY